MPKTAAPLQYKRVLVKVSGEAMMGSNPFGIDETTIAAIAKDLTDAVDAGGEICCVVGGGNIFRGISLATHGMNRTAADHIGMLATVMNGLALHAAIEANGKHARVMSAIPMQSVCEAFSRDKAIYHMKKGRVVIFVAGIGNPYFTTDTTAVLRAAEMDCHAVIKATQVDGVYSADPKKDPTAKRYDTLTYQEALEKHLKVMDATAIALARDAHMPLIVCKITQEGGITGVLNGTAKFSVVTDA